LTRVPCNIMRPSLKTAISWNILSRIMRVLTVGRIRMCSKLDVGQAVIYCVLHRVEPMLRESTCLHTPQVWHYHGYDCTIVAARLETPMPRTFRLKMTPSTLYIPGGYCIIPPILREHLMKYFVCLNPEAKFALCYTIGIPLLPFNSMPHTAYWASNPSIV